MAASRGQNRDPFFYRFARVVIRYRWIFLSLSLLGTAYFALQILTKLRIDTSTEAFLSKTSLVQKNLDRFRSEFGRDDVFIILVAGEVFSLPYLQRLQRLHLELQRLDVGLLPDRFAKKADRSADDFGAFEDAGEEWEKESGGTIVDEITSLINIRQTVSTKDGIRVEKFMTPLPELLELDTYKRRALQDHTISQVVGKEGTLSLILVRTQLMSEDNSNRVYQAIATICDKYESPQFHLSIAGMAALAANLKFYMMGDLVRMLIVSILLILIMLTVIFRHPLPVGAVILVVVQAAIWSVGTMTLLDYPLTMVSNIIPAFLFCVGLGDSIHLISLFRDQLKIGVDRHKSLIFAVGEAGTPILFTSLTTMVGLISLNAAKSDAIGEMGMAASVGILMALTYSLVFLPIILSFSKESLFGVSLQQQPDFFDRLLMFCTNLSRASSYGLAKKYRVLLGAGFLSLLSALALTQIRVWHNPLSWFPSDSGVKQAFLTVDQQVGGSSNIQLLIESKNGKNIKQLPLLQAMDQLQNELLAYEEVDVPSPLIGNISSILDVVKETNRALNAGAAQFYRLPETDRGISDNLFLFENAGQDHLRRLVTGDFAKTQMTLQMKWMDATGYTPFIAFMKSRMQHYLSNIAEVVPTGAVFTLVSTVASIIHDMLKSFLLALVVITLMMIVVLRSIKLGLIAMVPNLIPILFILGFMGLFDIPIDMGNLLIASIAIGIAVDDTIHYLHHFQSFYRQTQDVEQAIAHVISYAGRAIISTSVILIAGFLVYACAAMGNVIMFGLLVSLTIFFALFVDLMVTPALLRTFYKTTPTREVSL